ncbi:hypothetical protein FGIG_03469 [Fasciola gigantica]|uniref:Uncharacterized protein n=1 Tax=Fasciola gigantica TaxID=46835 RepID=A0A504YNN9_FASGI|nr:hypothetical protein FGIG_03469 [Fasciola gigantica]
MGWASTGQTTHITVTGREMRINTDMSNPHPAPDGLFAGDYVIQSRKGLVHIHRPARQQLPAEHSRHKEYYDESTYGSLLKPGDRVWLLSEQVDPELPTELHRAWTGSYEVREILSDSTCSIQ